MGKSDWSGVLFGALALFHLVYANEFAADPTDFLLKIIVMTVTFIAVEGVIFDDD